MLMPRKVRHRKQQRGRLSGPSKGGTEVVFGEYGIQALEPGWITARQIEAARIAMTRHIKRGGKVWINVFPDKSVTKKPAETRMGSGKGSPEGWVAVIKPGRVMFELAGDVLEAEVEQLLLRLGELGEQLTVGDVAQRLLGAGHQNASSRVTNRALIGSFWIARSMAARAMTGSL